MGYRVIGVDRATGEAAQFLSKAKDEQSARRSAEALGVAVESLKWCDDPVAEELAQLAATKSASKSDDPNLVVLVDPKVALQSDRRRFGTLAICIGAALAIAGVVVITVGGDFYDIPGFGMTLTVAGGVLMLFGLIRKIVESQDD